MQVTTNLDDSFILDAEHPLEISEDGDLYITLGVTYRLKCIVMFIISGLS